MILSGQIDPSKIERQNRDHYRRLNHDLRSPVNGILAIVEMMKDDVREEEVRKDLELISRSGSIMKPAGSMGVRTPAGTGMHWVGRTLSISVVCGFRRHLFFRTGSIACRVPESWSCLAGQ